MGQGELITRRPQRAQRGEKKEEEKVWLISYQRMTSRNDAQQSLFKRSNQQT